MQLVKGISGKEYVHQEKPEVPNFVDGKSAEEKSPPPTPSPKFTAILGFEIVSTNEDNGRREYICRFKGDASTWMARLAWLQAKIPSFRAAKVYMLKDGKLVYAWSLSIPIEEEDNLYQLVQRAASLFPVPVTKVKYMAPLAGDGELAENVRNPTSGSGAGVIPR